MTAKRHGARKVTAGSRKSQNTATYSQRKYGNPKSKLPRTTAKKLTGDGSFNYGFSKNRKIKTSSGRLPQPAKRIRKAGKHRRK